MQPSMGMFCNVSLCAILRVGAITRRNTLPDGAFVCVCVSLHGGSVAVREVGGTLRPFTPCRALHTYCTHAACQPSHLNTCIQAHIELPRQAVCKSAVRRYLPSTRPPATRHAWLFPRHGQSIKRKIQRTKKKCSPCRIKAVLFCLLHTDASMYVRTYVYIQSLPIALVAKKNKK